MKIKLVSLCAIATQQGAKSNNLLFSYLSEKMPREMSKEAKERTDRYRLRLARILLLTAELVVVF